MACRRAASEGKKRKSNKKRRSCGPPVGDRGKRRGLRVSRVGKAGGPRSLRLKKKDTQAMAIAGGKRRVSPIQYV